jgi:TM2 domain-containing membrane protein YozV
MTALVLSIIPGLGQWYKGQPIRGLFWFLVVALLYATGSPVAFVIHLVCAANAAIAGAIREDAVVRARRRGGRRRFSTTMGPRL